MRRCCANVTIMKPHACGLRLAKLENRTREQNKPTSIFIGRLNRSLYLSLKEIDKRRKYFVATVVNMIELLNAVKLIQSRKHIRCDLMA